MPVKLTYVLILNLPCKRSIKIGRLGKVSFQPGLYFYVGSGGSSPSRRLARHARRRKRKFWHIDYLTVHSDVIGAITVESKQSLECALAGSMARVFSSVAGFGSSDCRCRSHLFYAGSRGGGKT